MPIFLRVPDFVKLWGNESRSSSRLGRFHCQLKIISITERRPNFEYFEFWLLHRIRVAVPKATFDKREKRR